MKQKLTITAIATAALTLTLTLSACAGPAAALDGDHFQIPSFGPFRFSAESAPERITLPAPTKAEPIVREPADDEPLVMPMVAPASVPATDQLATRTQRDSQRCSCY